MAMKKPNNGSAMTKGQKVAAIKIASTKPKPTVKTKVQEKVKEVKSTYDKISKIKPPAKGGPRPKMERVAQPMKPKRMAQPAKPNRMAKKGR